MLNGKMQKIKQRKYNEKMKQKTLLKTTTKNKLKFFQISNEKTKTRKKIIKKRRKKK